MENWILYQDEDLLVIDKPEGFHVHRPEDRRLRIPKERILIYQLRDRFGESLSPVHRLDAATSGCLIWAKNRPSASALCAQFSQSRLVQKNYLALVRGWIPQDLHIDIPLQSDSSDALLEAVTDVRVVQHFEAPFQIGKRAYSSSRFTLIEVSPRTGRYRQIRRHLKRLNHPIIGDFDCGDPFYNRFFRDELSLHGLFLRAYEIEFDHPRSGQRLRIKAPMAGKWERLKSLFLPYRKDDGGLRNQQSQ